MSQLIPFEFEGRSVRIVTDEQGIPWFVAKDIAENLGYADSAAAVQKHCKRYKPLNQLNSDNSSELSPKLLMITEADLYRLVVKSAKPEADRFEEWIMEDVLPSIRKTGSYSIRPKTALELAREQVTLLEHIEQLTQERNHAIATKAEIGSRREATAMNTASQAVKRVNQLEAELDKSKQYCTVKRMQMIHHGQQFNWRRLKSTGTEMGIEPIDVFDANYGTVKAYHVEVWREAYAVELPDAA